MTKHFKAFYILPLGQLKYILAYHWSFVLYNVIFFIGTVSCFSLTRRFDKINYLTISGRCTGLHGIAPSPSQQLSRPSSATVAADLGGRGDFHYSVEPVYRRPRDLTSSYHHSSRASSGGGSQSDAYSDYAYLEHKASPYHTGMFLLFCFVAKLL